MSLKDRIAELGLSVESIFIPYELSKGAVDNPRTRDRTMNWRIKILQSGKEVLTTDFFCGVKSIDDVRRVNFETNTGIDYKTKLRIKPDIEDIIFAVVSDADVLNYASMEDWAYNWGYDPLTIEAQEIYNLCLKNSLALVNNLGQTAFNLLKYAIEKEPQ